MADVLERGDMFFLYRPKVDNEHPEDLDDVQRFYLVLTPDGQDRFRRIVIGRKYMSNIEEHERNWAFVDLVGNAKTMHEDLEAEDYQTKTRGEQHQPAARPAAEGRYAVVRHDNHTHLAYALELPRKTGEAQHEFQIEDEGSYIVSVKNPEVGNARNAGLSPKRKADFPKRFSEKFEDRRWIDLDPPEFLDYEGCELVLIGAKENAEEELDIRFHTRKQTVENSDTVKELGLKPENHPVEALKEGKIA